MKQAPLLLIGWAAALLLAFHPMLFSGLARVPGDLGDARLVNYLLEHTWRWLLREPPHRDLWSPPVFYPAGNTAAYSDLLLSAGPFYWCWRAGGFPADTAFQLWLLTVSSLNYLTTYAFLARVLRLRGLAAALGGVLFTAGNCRLSEVVHPQLYVQFFTVLALHALVRFFEAGEEPAGRARPFFWFGAFSMASVAQIYASFYLGWFLALALLIAAAVACSCTATRRALFAVLKSRRQVVIGWAAASAFLAGPLAWHYLVAAREVGVRDWGAVASGLPSPWAWFLLNRSSWLYGWAPFLHAAPGEPGMEEMGVGLVTTIVAVWGLWRTRESPRYSFLAATAGVLVVLVTAVGPLTPWVVVYFCVPGGAAIRAAFRLCLLVLFAQAAGAASFVHAQKRIGVAAALSALCVLEQGRAIPTFSKEEGRRRAAAVAARVPPDCRAFLYTPDGDTRSFVEQAFVNVDAMWAGLEAGKPTVNGYSGNAPPHYPFWTPVVGGPDDLRERGASLNDWCERRGLDSASVAWIHD